VPADGAHLPRLASRGWSRVGTRLPCPDVTVREFFLRRIRAGGKACGRSIHDLDRYSPLHVLSWEFISPRTAASGGFQDLGTSRRYPETGSRRAGGITASPRDHVQRVIGIGRVRPVGRGPDGVTQRVAAAATAGLAGCRPRRPRARIRLASAALGRELRPARTPARGPPPAASRRPRRRRGACRS
jgi:hypothetical protein